jgi:hypothetical protein
MFRKIEERFRVSPGAGNETQTNYKIGKVSTVFQITPLFLSLAVLLATSQGFFGLTKQSSIPQEGNTFQKYCQRESFVRQFPCRFDGPITGKKLLLLGDSHAAQYSIDIWKLASEQGYEVYFGGDFGGPIDTSKVISLATNIKPQKIIISKFWKLDGKKIEQNTLTALLKLHRLNNNLRLVSQSPIFEAKNSPQRRVTLMGTYFSKGKNLIDLQKQDFKKMDSTANIAGVEIDKFAHNLKIPIVDPKAVLCKKKVCHRWFKNRPLYIDGNHLSTFGAKLVRPLILSLIKN